MSTSPTTTSGEAAKTRAAAASSSAAGSRERAAIGARSLPQGSRAGRSTPSARRRTLRETFGQSPNGRRRVINDRAHPSHRRDQRVGPRGTDLPHPLSARPSRGPGGHPPAVRGAGSRSRGDCRSGPARRPPLHADAAPGRLLPGGLPAPRLQHARAAHSGAARRPARRDPDRRGPGPLRRRRDRVAAALRPARAERRPLHVLRDVLLPGAHPRIHPLAPRPRRPRAATSSR